MDSTRQCVFKGNYARLPTPMRELGYALLFISKASGFFACVFRRVGFIRYATIYPLCYDMGDLKERFGTLYAKIDHLSGAPVIAMKPRLVDDTEPAADECGDDDLFFLLVRRKFARIDEAAKDCAKAKIFEVLSSTNHDKRT